MLKLKVSRATHSFPEFAKAEGNSAAHSFPELARAGGMSGSPFMPKIAKGGENWSSSSNPRANKSQTLLKQAMKINLIKYEKDYRQEQDSINKLCRKQETITQRLTLQFPGF